MEENNKNWSVQSLWNDGLVLDREERKLEAREHMWASEIGKGYYERFLKMSGVAPDIPYDERTLRKFAAGNLFERMIGYVLMSAGILKHDNKWMSIEGDGDHLRVTVKPDFIAGGKPDWSKVRDVIEDDKMFELLPVFGRIARSLVDHLSEKFPEGMDDLVYEIKSINSLIFWMKKDYLKEAYPHHVMQLYTGMKASGIPEGRLLYISKDDLTVAEFPVMLNDKKLETAWEEDVRTMTKYIRDGVEPPKPESEIGRAHV